MHKMHKKKQSGFTILEIGIVMIILVSLVVAFSSGLWEKQRASEVQLIKMWFTKTAPEAVTTCRLKYGIKLGNITNPPGPGTKEGLVSCGLSEQTIYEEDWTVKNPSVGTGSHTSVEITYPLTGMEDFGTDGAAIAQTIKDEGGDAILDSTFTTPNLVIEVRVH